MIGGVKLVVLFSLVSCTTKWKRKKPAYWEFPETSTTERPDVSAEYCKSVNMDELGANITGIVTKPVRGHAEPLLNAVVLYVLTLHRFIRKCNTTDDIAIRMARDLIENKRPSFLDMEIDMPTINRRVGFDRYEFQHFQWVWEDIVNSWEKLKEIVLGTTLEKGEM
ncbi:hypothetical protein J6590_066888 [Homalodisca vitripennis]|nr:hypothetical protein J6590_066888 [Homalodisca vitripennis]